MRFALPIKPLSVNKAYQGRRFKTKEHNQYCKDVAILLPKGRKISGFVKITYDFFLTNWKRTDGDNLVKPLTDVIVSCGLIDDDRFIMEYVIRKHSAKEDRIDICIEEWIS